MTADREHYLDNLRALAMLAGVLFHAALAHSIVMQPFWPTADRAHSPMADIFAWFLHMFRMPLFFMIAGYFTAALVERRGMAGMMVNRSQRVLLPFLVLLVPILASLSWTITWATEHVEHPSALLLLIKQWSRMEQPPELPPSTSHLWFLYYLMLFYVLLWAIRTLWSSRIPLPERLPVWSLAVLPLVLVPPLLAVSAPHPAPESFLPQFWAIGFFGAYFALGLALHHRPSLFERFAPHLPWLMLASAALYAVWCYCLPRLHPDPVDMSAPWPMALLGAYIGFYLSVALWLLGQRFLNLQRPWLRYLAAASYWTYLVHLPLLFVIQFWLMDQPWHGLGKFSLAVTLTLALCFASYHLLVRTTGLRRWLG